MHQIDDLRTHLFETLAALRDKDQPMEIDRARAVADVARVIVDSAKVEVRFLEVTGATRSTDFLPIVDSTPARPQLAGNGTVRQPSASRPVEATRPERQVGDKKFEVVFDGSKEQTLIGDRNSVQR